MTDEPIYVLAVLALSVAVSEWLVRTTSLKHVGTALLVIVVMAIAANTGVVPPYGADTPVYDAVFEYGVNLGVFWLLLGVRLVDVRRAGRPLLLLFAAGAVGTFLGVVAGLFTIDAQSSIGGLWQELGGMFVATYTGGSANLNLVAYEYGIARDGGLYLGANAVDAIMTTVWMIGTIALPRALRRLWPRERSVGAVGAPGGGDVEEREHVDPAQLGVLFALGLGAYFASELGTAAANDWLAGAGLEKVRIPQVLVVTTVALLLAQVRAVSKLSGARLLGMFALYLFLGVIGALCDLETLRQMGSQAGALFLFVTVAIGVHGLVVFGTAGLLKLDWDLAAVASQANVGGGSTALALARSLGRPDLAVPAILIGSVGTASGTYLGFATVEFLRLL